MKHPERYPEKYTSKSESDHLAAPGISTISRDASAKKKRSFFRIFLHVVGWLILLSLVMMAILGGIVGGYLYTLYAELPSISRLEEFSPSSVTKVYDRNDELIGEFFFEKRALVNFEELPEDFVNALIASEDKRFFQHFGIDPIGFGRAIIKNIKRRSFAQGASTITQQLTRLLFLSPEKKIPRKIKEWMLAIQIEQKYKNLEQDNRKAKQKILELYANQYYWGHGIYGIQTAAKLYFGKDVGELNLGECAMLAGLVQRPARYSPIRHLKEAKQRQAYVLGRMVIDGYIVEGTFKLTEEALTALQEEEIPEEIYTKLEGLKDREYDSEEEFAKALETAIGKEQSEQYKTLIMLSAAEPSFTLTDWALAKLKGKNIAEKEYKKLENLTHLGHMSKTEFVKTLEKTLGKDQVEQYKPLILKYAAHETAKKARVQPYEKKEVPAHQIDKAPYFVEHVRQYLEERYGFRAYQDGLQVYTTLDLHLQDVARSVLQKGLRTIQKRHGFKLYDRDKTPEEREERLQFIEQVEWKNPPEKGDLRHAIVTEVGKKIKVRIKDYAGTIGGIKGFQFQVDDIVLVNVLEVDEENHALKLKLDMEPILEGAIVSIDPKTGHILAMVGGYDFYRSKFNRAVQALRQPGSSFKPFVYLTALEQGRTPADIIVDEPVTFVIDPRNEKTWSPKNFSGDHKGPLTLRTALEKSINVVAAKLIDQIGPHAVVDTARRLGITAYLNPYPSLALGGSEVYLLEMVSAYGTFANQGFRVAPIFVTKVLDREGNVLEENVPRARQVLAEDTNYILVSMMRGVVQRGTAAAASSLGRPLAGKTGTTNDNTNALFLGYSPSLVTGVWVGYDENRKPIGQKETGSRAALPIWMDFMEEALKDTPVEDFPVPAGVSFVQIDPETGLLAAPQCGDSFTEVFKKGTEPKEYCYQYRDYSYSP
jgi:penicillin-binding protein 1A